MEAHSEICKAIDSYRETVVSLSHEIHEHPEPRFREHFACDLLSRAIRDLGLEVQTKVGGLETSFRTEFGNPGPTIAILAEYDALPNGHSCGHNLIAGAALAAAAGLASMRQRLPGRVVLMGTPAEEGGGGKIILLNKGGFDGVDAAIMAHPSDCEFSGMPVLAMEYMRMTFRGRAAHAAAAPWAGASALSAVLQTFQSVDTARLHFRDNSRVHGIITNGGQAANIVPELAQCEFIARATTERHASEIANRIRRCADAAAMATGVTVEHETICAYKDLITNRAIAQIYERHSEALGTVTRQAQPGTPTGSTDMGDISHAMPAIHPMFQVSKHGEGTCHEDAFVKFSDSQNAYSVMMRVAKAMALTAHDLLAEPASLEAAKAEFAAVRK
ncbi:MAG TPA: amidohydrolase [Candidatus Binataceae bacterium]|nr:amidohydrolase [Candidatus Binataceae bacterium]